MREVLRAVAGFSGVELPGLPSEPQDENAPVPRLDIRNLKDRFRRDLEGFSIKTTEELAKRARERTRAALESVQEEVGGMVDKVAAEFREDLQLPAQIEKLLEPCVEDAETRLERSISQKFEQLVAQHEQLVQEKIQGTLSSVQEQMTALEQAVQQIRELRTEAVAQASGDQVSTAEVVGRIDELAAEFRQQLQDQAQFDKLLEPRVDETAARLEKSISQKVEDLVAQHEQMVHQKLQETLSSVQTQMSGLEQTVQEVRGLKADLSARAAEKPANAAADVEHLLAEQNEMVQQKLQEALNPVQAQISTLEETVQEVRGLKADLAAQTAAEPRSTAADVEPLLAEHKKMVQQKLQEALNPVQAQMSALEQVVQQIRELKVEAVVPPSSEQLSAAEVAGRLDQLAAEFRQKLQEQSQIEKRSEPSVDEVAARLEKSISQKVEQLLAQHDQVVQQKFQGTLSSVQGKIGALEQTVEQIRDLKAESVTQLPVAPLAVSVDPAPKKEQGRLDNGLKEFLDQSFSRIEGSFSDLRETRKVKPPQTSSASLEYLRQAIPSGSPDMLLRVQQALDNLDRLGSKDPQPAS